MRQQTGCCEGKETEHFGGEDMRVNGEWKIHQTLLFFFFDSHSVIHMIWNLLCTCADYLLSI